MGHRDGHVQWCQENGRPDDLGADPLEPGVHADGTDTCSGPAADVQGVFAWLTSTPGSPSRCVIGAGELDAGGLSTFIAELNARLVLLLAGPATA